MTINEQIRYNNLDLIYSNLSFAYLNNDEVNMKYYFQKFADEYPEYRGQMTNCLNSAFYENNCMPSIIKVSIYATSGNDLRYNVIGCLNSIKKVLNDYHYYSFSLGAIQTLYYPPVSFTPTYELYRGEYLSQQDSYGETPYKKDVRILNVSDLLSVADYSVKILDSLNPSEKTQDISDAITILKGIDLALNNKPQDKPLNKSLHIVNSVLSSTVKHSLDNNIDKQFTGTMSMLIDLAIDFFCKK